MALGNDSKIVNSTIYGNDAESSSYGGGAIISGNVEIINSIIWGNFPEQIYLQGVNANVQISFSNIDQDGFAGNGNIRLSPEFVNIAGIDATLWDLRLQPSSPCINAGTNSAADLPPVDIDGKVRISGSAVDMGAYEYQFDTTAPIIELTSPANRSEAPIDTNIVVELSDDVSGIATGSIVMQVDGAAVTPAVAGGGTHYTLTYDRPNNFGYSQAVSVTVSCTDLAGNATGIQTFTFQTGLFSGPAYPADESDPDGDGIQNRYELAYGTDPGRKTLFVRPKKKVGNSWSFWEEFCDDYRPLLTAYSGTEAGQLGIEIVCVGSWLKSDGTHQLLYDRLWDLNYDPKTDTTGPAASETGEPIDIMEISYNDPAAPSGLLLSTYAHGHTFFESVSIAMPGGTTETVWTWYWDITGNSGSTMSFGDNGYLTGHLYPFSIEKYFSEGQYDSIVTNATKQITEDNCDDAVCDEPASPFNHNKSSETPPWGVEFNSLVFDTVGAVTSVNFLSATQWDRPQVILRALAHEIGHALIASAIPENDHCDDTLCIMYPFNAQENQWTLTGFHCPVHTVEFVRGKIHNIAGAN